MSRLKNYIQYRVDLRRCRIAQRELDKSRPPETREAHECGQLADYYRRDSELFEWKRLIQTRYYSRLAYELEIPMPDINDPTMYDEVSWDNDEETPKYLSDQGLVAIRAGIRTEQKHGQDRVSYWFGILIGLIGALTGLVSAFKG